MSNTLTYLPVIQEGLSKQLIQKATSSWMEANASRIKYEGGKEFKIGVLTTDGLGDYGRTDGNQDGSYPKGALNLTYETHSMEMDRAKEFLLDRHDVDETNFLVTATSVGNEFQMRHVIPEMDAYRYAKLASVATNKKKIKITESNILDELSADFYTFADRVGSSENLIVTMNYKVYALLAKAKADKGSISITDRNGIDIEVMTFNGVPIVPVSSSRMKTSFSFSSTAGFVEASDAEDINWIVCPTDLPTAVVKLDSMKVFTPDLNQDGDDWKIKYRVYHTLIVEENRLNELYVSLNA